MQMQTEVARFGDCQINWILVLLLVLALPNSGCVGVASKVAPPSTPSIAIISPSSGATLSGAITVSTSVSSNTVSVQFKVDGNNTGSPVTSAPFSYSLDTTTLSNDSHTISAVASNSSGQTATSAPVSVKVNNALPTISISSPASGATVSGSIIVSTSVSSNTVSVQFKVDGNNTGSPVTSAPFSYSLDTTTLSNDSHTISAVASNSGGQTASAPVIVNVNNPGTPSSLGWFQIPNTHLQDVCPPDSQGYSFSFKCQYVIKAWNGGIADEARNRMIIWGGGHNDYYGNEIYSLDLNTLKLTRLTDPSPINTVNSNSCPAALSDGKPNSRHSYGGLAYIKHADKMFVFSGSLACGGGSGDNDVWTLDLATLQWTRKNPVGGPQPIGYNLDAIAAYDPNTKLVFVHDRKALYSYSLEQNAWTHLSDFETGVAQVGVIDPKRKLFVVFGPHVDTNSPSVLAVSIAPGSTYTKEEWSTSGCDGLIGGDDYPGLAYDPVQDRIVGWVNSGNPNSVYIFNADTKSCTTQTFSGGPALDPETRGTFGRWQYFPNLGVFATVNAWNQNAFTLRMTQGGPSADFATRCAAPSVVRCYGFDDAVDAAKYTVLGGGDPNNLPQVDTSVKASGAGSLRFTFPPNSGDGSAGSFPFNFSSDLSFQLGDKNNPPNEVYIQWRQRFNDAFLTVLDSNGEGPKQAIIAGGDTPGKIADACTQIQVVLQDVSRRFAPQMFHSCGGKDGQYEPLEILRPDGEIELQNAVHCLWAHGGPLSFPPCIGYKPNQWMTFQIRIKVGTWYKNDGVYHHDSTIQLWVAEEGKPSILVIDFSPESGTGYDLANQTTEKYGKIWLTPYWSNKNPNQTNSVMQTWYDELVISRNKIADPK